MDPTLVAPTATREMKPCSQFPIYATLSLRQNKSGIRRITDGLTLSNKPVANTQYIKKISRHMAQLLHTSECKVITQSS